MFSVCLLWTLHLKVLVINADDKITRGNGMLAGIVEESLRNLFRGEDFGVEECFTEKTSQKYGHIERLSRAWPKKSQKKIQFSFLCK